MDWHLCRPDRTHFKGCSCVFLSNFNIISHFPEFHILSSTRFSGLYCKSVQSVQFSSVASPFHLSLLVFFNKKCNVNKSNELFNFIIKINFNKSRSLPDKK